MLDMGDGNACLCRSQQIIQDVTGINYNTGEQNKGMSVTRQDRDWKDTNTVLRYLSDRNPFTSDIGLHNISTGVYASSQFPSY